MNWTQVILAILGGGGGLAGIATIGITIRQNRAAASKTEAEASKTDTESAQIVQSMALELVQPMQTELVALRKDVADLQRKRVEDLRRITDLEDDRTTLAEAVYEQMIWQEAGAAPPPPIFSARVRALIAELHTT